MENLIYLNYSAIVYNEHGESVLTACVRANNFEVLRLLISTSFNVNERDAIAQLPLCLAIRLQHKECINVLLSIDENENPIDVYGRKVPFFSNMIDVNLQITDKKGHFPSI